MKKDGGLIFITGDYLGSTSIVTDDVGNVLSEMRYTPCPTGMLTLRVRWREGEVRYATGNLNTDYQYTGQRTVGEIGLHFYNARWYDSSLSRFAQADTIIPSTQGVQGYDRYAYTNNNPVRYVDPSGNIICMDGERCYTGSGSHPGGWSGGGQNPFAPNQQDISNAISAGYQASLERGMEFVNGLLNHRGWWTPYLTSGNFEEAWTFLLAFAYLWESYSYKAMSDWNDFKSLMTESIVNKAGELYKNYGVAGLYVYLGGREALFKSRGNISGDDPRWQEGTGAYLNTWDLKYLGAENVWNDIYVKGGSEMNTVWPGVANWQGTIGIGAWDYGVTPPLKVDESKVVWRGQTINGMVNPWTGNVEAYYIYFISK
jgi:RHS repeat-associated protein